ncbi:MAG: hypothetical protein ACP5HQ_07550 [Thermoprotei archaeon]
MANYNSLTPFESINGLQLSFKHIKVWFTAGVGFFTDDYDLGFVVMAVLCAMVASLAMASGTSNKGFLVPKSLALDVEL